VSVVELWPLPAILLPVLAYARHPDTGKGRLAAFVVGWTLAVLSLSGVSDGIAERSFFLHMVAHAVLMGVAAPLLVLARPLPRLIGPLRFLTEPVTATFLQAGILAAWHLPVLFDAALDDRRIHALQHLMLLGSSLLFWQGIGEARRSEERQGLAVVCLFLASVLGTLLGFLLTLASGLWYTPIEAPICGLSPLADQQLGGLVMWVPAGLVYVAAGLGLLARWIKGSAASTAWTPEQG
jgi:cytochrome c oxidase assembly factor CtaG